MFTHLLCHLFSLSFEVAIRLFSFLFMFSRFFYCCFSVCPEVISINIAVSGYRNQSFFAPFPVSIGLFV